MTEIELLEKTLVAQNPDILLLNGYYKILPKDPDSDTPLIVWKLNSSQLKRLHLVNRFKQSATSAVKILDLKGRQMGASTFWEGYLHAHVSQRKGVQACIIADDVPGSSYILNMSKRYQRELEKNYPHIATPIRQTNEKKVVFADTESFIMVDTSNNIDAGQKYTYHLVHCSEIAKFDHPDELMGGFLQSVPKNPSSLIACESTANGIGNWFHREVMKAYSHETDWHLIFTPWFEHAEYQLPVSKKQRKFLTNTMIVEESALITQFNCTHEQLWWRRMTVINDCQGCNMQKNDDTTTPDAMLYEPDLSFQGSLDLFDQYFPSSVEKAFIASGRSVFNITALKTMQNTAPRMIAYNYTTGKTTEPLKPGVNYARGRLYEEKDAFYFSFELSGSWCVFELPTVGVDYMLGADVAEGIEKEGGTKQNDYSAVSIRRRDTLAQVACYRAHIDTASFAHEIRYAAMCYNGCMVACERNNHGHAVIQELLKIYPWLYMEESEDERTHVRTRKVGWETNRITRHLAIDNYNKLLNNGSISLRSRNGITEAMSFITKPDGRQEANSGCFDDELFADMICCEVHFRVPMAVNFKNTVRLLQMK
jgi:hypothetical protein